MKALKHQKILNLLNEASDFRFVRRKQNIVNDQSNASYSIGNKIIYSRKVLKSNLCDCKDAYILIKGDIIGHNLVTPVALNNFAVCTE